MRQKVLLAGATGYLGSYISTELKNRGCFTRAVVRNPEKARRRKVQADEMVTAHLTDTGSIAGICYGMDVVFSTIGITHQKDGLTYMDVDYQANWNLLQEARKSRVGKFIYVSLLNGEHLRHLKICEAKEAFADQLRISGLPYCIIRPNGFFSDIKAFYSMARNGRVFLFGNAECQINLIHGKDLATVCVDAMDRSDREVRAGGPEILTYREIARAAFKVLGREPKITTIPDWENWTGLVFPESGEYVVKDALQPVRIDVRSDLGVYEEPNVWMQHALR